MDKEPEWLRGTYLSKEEKKYVLSSYIHRFTWNHKPRWVKNEPLQFASDEEWLSRTFFRVKNNFSLDKRFRYCHSHPTWPNNPELRKGSQ